MIGVAVGALMLLAPGCAVQGPVEPAFDEGAEFNATLRALGNLDVPLHDGITVLMKVIEPGASWVYEQELDDPYEGIVEWHRQAYASNGWTLEGEKRVDDDGWTVVSFHFSKEQAESIVVMRDEDDWRTTVIVTFGVDAALGDTF